MNVPVTNLQVLDLPTSTNTDRESHAALLLEMQIRKVAASLLDVPTLPHQVRDALRQRGEPVRLFGENNANIRDRLRLLLAKEEVMQRVAGGEVLATTTPATQEYGAAQVKLETVETRDETNVTKYTHASEELVSARDFIAQFSIQKAQNRLNIERKRRWAAKKRSRLEREGGNNKYISMATEEDETQKNLEQGDTLKFLYRMDTDCQKLYNSLRTLTLEGSQYGDGRPLSALCTSNPIEALENNNMHKVDNIIATGGWSGSVKVWDGNSASLNLLTTKAQAHEDRITGIALHAYQSHDCTQFIGTASIDLTGKLWRVHRNGVVKKVDDEMVDHVQYPYELEEVVLLKGHERRLCKIAFHPSGKFVGTTSFDHTWRLWDIEAGGKELLLQDGHWKEVFGIGFHPDGSLVSTTDFGSIVQIWDLRTGKSACHFSGHALRVLCTQFSPNGFQLATAGDDGTIKIWDLRQRKQYASIPAHSRLINQLKFAHDCKGQNGEFLASCSFDGQGKIWSTRDWKLLNTVRGHDGKVMGIDILHGQDLGIVTCGYDKTLKIWRC